MYFALKLLFNSKLHMYKKISFIKLLTLTEVKLQFQFACRARSRIYWTDPLSTGTSMLPVCKHQGFHKTEQMGRLVQPSL